MNRMSCRLAILALVAASAGKASAAVPLAELTPKQVAERLNAYLGDKPENLANWERRLGEKGLPPRLPVPEESRLELSIDRATGEVRKFIWIVPTRESLSSEKQRELDAILKDLFIQSAVQFLPKDGPLLEEKDAKTLYEKLTARTGPLPPPTLTVADPSRIAAGKAVAILIAAKSAGRPTVELPKSPGTRIEVKPTPTGWIAQFPAPAEPGTYAVQITLVSPDGLVATATKTVPLMVVKPEIPETVPVPNPIVARKPAGPQVVVGLMIVSGSPYGGGPAIVPIYAPAWGGPSYWHPPVPPTPAPEYPVPMAVASPKRPGAPNTVTVSRRELLASKEPEAWAWYDRGLASYWSGATAQAVEYLAAAATVSEDPRIWSYLSLALDAEGKTTEAREAGRFAAAAKLSAEGDSNLLAEALERVQGPRRAGLEDHAAGVNASNARIVMQSVRNARWVSNSLKASVGVR